MCACFHPISDGRCTKAVFQPMKKGESQKYSLRRHLVADDDEGKKSPQPRAFPFDVHTETHTLRGNPAFTPARRLLQSKGIGQVAKALVPPSFPSIDQPAQKKAHSHSSSSRCPHRYCACVCMPTTVCLCVWQHAAAACGAREHLLAEKPAGHAARFARSMMDELVADVRFS